MGRSIEAKQILTNATGTGAGASFSTQGHTNLTFFFVATSVTSGATIKVQGSGDGGTTWVDITADQVIAADGSTEVTLAEFWPLVRLNVSAHTDGTYNGYLSASGYSGIR